MNHAPEKTAELTRVSLSAFFPRTLKLYGDNQGHYQVHEASDTTWWQQSGRAPPADL